MKKATYKVVNCYTKIKDAKEFYSLSVPKTIISKKNHLMYMSRSPVPGSKKNLFVKGKKQVCIYGFKRDILLRFYSSSQKKTENEKIEDIEIIRLLENNIPIYMIEVTGSKLAIDTLEDFIKAKKIFKIR